MIRKRIFQCVRIICLALGISVVLLLPWSYYHWDDMTFRFPARIEIVSERGGLGVVYYLGHSNGPTFNWLEYHATPRPSRWSVLQLDQESWWGRRGFASRFYHVYDGYVAAPTWFVALILLVVAFEEGAQQAILQRLPPVPRSTRPRLLRVIRLLLLAIFTAVIASVVVAFAGRFNLKLLWDALVATPIICGLFLIVPLVGIWLVRKPLAVQKRRLLIHRDRYLCTACGYNLTKNTTDICPECGTASTRLKKRIEGEPRR